MPDPILESSPDPSALTLLLMLAVAAATGFAAGLCLHAERLRQADWRARRAEAMCNSLRRLSDEYRKRLSGRSPKQAQKKLEEQERKLAMLHFKVGSLRSELKSLQPRSPEIIDLSGAGSAPAAGGEGRC